MIEYTLIATMILIVVTIIFVPAIIIAKMIITEYLAKKRKEKGLEDHIVKKFLLRVTQMKELCKKWNETGGKLAGFDQSTFNNFVKDGSIIIEKVDNKQIAKLPNRIINC